MDAIKKQHVLEVLKYWEFIEFLGQDDIDPKSSDEDKIKKIKDNVPLPRSTRKLEICHYLDENIDDFENFSLEEKSEEIMLSEDCKKIKNLKFGDFIGNDNKIFADFTEKNLPTLYIGRIPRNLIVEYLSKYLPNDELPEKPYQDDQSIAWFAFKTDSCGNYISDTFELSPILWTLYQWNKDGVNMSIDLDVYHKICGDINGILLNFQIKDEDNKRFEVYLPKLYTLVFNNYVKPLFSNALKIPGHLGYFKYTRSKPPKKGKKLKEKNPVRLLGDSFYLSDIGLVKEKIINDEFGDKNGYERNVINYILSADKVCDVNKGIERTLISPKNDPNKSFNFFADILNIENAPYGKWPSQHKPALMQQTAVNIAINRGENETPIFSVNGPPGTGKTTLLKEILADNIVKRAKTIMDLAKGDPDSIFEAVSLNDKVNCFKIKSEYDVINDYGMLVASCNNAAVENITIDLPQFGDLLKNLKNDEKPGLKEIYDLFDPDSPNNDRDIFFTKYSDKLANPKIDQDDDEAEDDDNEEDDNDEENSRSDLKRTWGLISAPLGKSQNIKKYNKYVLKPFCEDYTEENRAEHHTKYLETCKKFSAQYALVEAIKKELSKICRGCIEHPDSFKHPDGFKMDVIDKEFKCAYSSADDTESTDAQLVNPWTTDRFDREREKLFYYACKLHEEFIASSKCMRKIIEYAPSVLRKKPNSNFPDNNICSAVLQCLFLLTPVFSTTFAAAQRFLSTINKGTIGILIVDEAGQAPPHVAVGSLYRCRKAIIVGDPKQIEPVVTAETDMFKKLITSDALTNYKDKHISVQGFADNINPYGTYLGEGDEREWVGCPLVVHRRCTDPMFSISNKLSYDETMKSKSKKPDNAANYILNGSLWIDVQGKEVGNKIHYVDSQGDVVLKLLDAAFKRTDDPDDLPGLYIISPFTSVIREIKNKIRNSELFNSEPRVKEWLKGDNIGTVHTFQGKGTSEVIFLLGCDETSVSAANWVSKNIVNVAATRAKKRFYMIGDKEVWESCVPVNTAREIINKEISASDLNALLAECEEAHSGAKPNDTVNALIHKPETSAPQRIMIPTSDIPKQAQPVTNRQANAPARVCSKCGRQMIIKNGLYGDFWGCTGYPECRHTEKINAYAQPQQKTAPAASNIPEQSRPVTDRQANAPTRVCPKCGRQMAIKKGTYGEFWGCTGYPECRYTEKISASAQSQQKADDPLITCPECGKEITKKNGQYGEFWSCSGYPNCNFKPVCPNCKKTLDLVTTGNGQRVWRCGRDGYTADRLSPR